jgi:hypothetical protein
MNPKALFAIMLIVLIIYLGMTQKQSVCNTPYILHGSECCIDSNLDGICDKDQPEAFVTTTSETTTTLDPCFGLSGYNLTSCVYEKEKRRYAGDCVESCGNASDVCRSACDLKELTKEKIACADLCFRNYTLCYSECGADAQIRPSVKSALSNQTKKNATALNRTDIL